MANFGLGDGKRLGKALPQHKLMQNLLMGQYGRRNVEKITIGTQTDCRRATSEMSCCCGQRRSQQNCSRNWMLKPVKKIMDEEVQKRRTSQTYQNLLASIRERVTVTKEDESCCSCSDTWSDNSTGDGDNIHFPKETRNAMCLLLSQSKHRRPPLKPITKRSKPSGAWPGVAERMDHDEEKRLINSDEIVAKITSKLSKNKLDIN